jgi:hypothetical protein
MFFFLLINSMKDFTPEKTTIKVRSQEKPTTGLTKHPTKYLLGIRIQDRLRRGQRKAESFLEGSLKFLRCTKQAAQIVRELADCGVTCSS